MARSRAASFPWATSLVQHTGRMLDEILLPAAAGVAAGLGVAMPLGAISALLLREGIVNGFRVAAAGGAGIALVDTVYCVVAAVAGSLVAPAVRDHSSIFLAVSGALIVAIGVHQLVGTLRAGTATADAVRPSSGVRTFTRFVALTAINPLTLVYFVALAGAIGARTSSAWGPVAFVVGVALASWAWQTFVAGLGATLGHSLGDRATRAIGLLASGVIVLLGVAVMVSGL